MKLGHYLRKLRTLPPGESARRIRDKIQDRCQAAAARWLGYRKTSFILRRPPWLAGGIGRRIPRLSPPESRKALEAARLLGGHALAHRFNLLGSGWTEVRAADGDNPINEANRKETARIRAMLPASYAPIDWHADFKSGYRWASDLWHADLTYGSTPGADVKVPWELCRMQHLSQLALAFAAAGAGAPGFEPPKAYVDEFRNQILDFIAANPPGFGVNWICTMDVAIRISNWLLARDLFLAHGAGFDAEFENEFAKSVCSHARHIMGNLEWGPGLRGNHYFADIAGLAAAACFLPPGEEPDAWLAFAVRELVNETRIQFLPDGGNFEASTCYHRLSSEMLTYATAMVLSLPPARLEGLLKAPPAHRRRFPRFFRYSPMAGHDYPGWQPLPFPPWYFERLERAAEFVMDLTRPDGRMPQIGDNDSGRFVRLFPVLGPDGEEDFLDHRHIAAAINGFFGRGDFAAFAGEAGCESAIVAGFLSGRRLPSYRVAGVQAPSGAAGPVIYPDFGIYVYRRHDAYLAFRCGPIGQLDMGGHAHNDQLSFEFALKGLVFLEDRGTYVYTPDWAERNRFRSTAWHNTLALEGAEQNPWMNTRPGLFSLLSRSRAEILELGEARIAGRHVGFGAEHRRILVLEAGRLEGEDRCEIAGARSLRFHFCREVALVLSRDGLGVDAERNGVRLRLRGTGGSWSLEDGATSPAYGVMRKAPVAVLGHLGDSPAKWYIEWSQ